MIFKPKAPTADTCSPLTTRTGSPGAGPVAAPQAGHGRIAQQAQQALQAAPRPHIDRVTVPSINTGGRSQTFGTSNLSGKAKD